MTKRPCALPIKGVGLSSRDPWTGTERRRQGIGAAFFVVCRPRAASAIIELGPHSGQPFTGDAVGLPLHASDQTAASQPFEYWQAAIRESEAIAVEAIDFNDFAVGVTPITDQSALREDVQHALLVFRDVQWNCPE
jgi:hypothetical protein